MNDETERRQARGVYLGGIGLFMMGIAAIVWSVAHVISSVAMARELGHFGNSQTITYPSWVAPRTYGTQTVEDVVRFLNGTNYTASNTLIRVETKTQNN